VKRILLVGIVALAVACASASVHARYVAVPEDLVVEFRDSANVVNREIMFTDIASVSTSDQSFMDVLSQVSLGPAPSKGYTRNLTAGYIGLRLRQRRIDPNDLPFEIPSSITVTAETTVLHSASIVAAARDFVQNELGAPLPEDAAVGYVPNLVIPVGEPAMECALIGGSTDSEYLTVGVTVYINGYVEGFVRVEFSKSSHIASSKPTGLVQQNPVENTSSASSTSAPKPTAHAAATPYLVTRGDTVYVIARTAFAEITTTAEARADGRLGDLIEVRNLDTGKRFVGRVVSAGVVEVDLGG
jgi:flagella basal body P-ring formation protein FlgA